MTYQIELIEPEAACQLWPTAAKLLEKTPEFSPGKFAVEDLLTSIEHNVAQLWLVNNEHEYTLAVVTQLIQYSRGMTLRILLTGGKDIREALSLLGDIEKWAIQQGCIGVELAGRLGWIKLLEDYDTRAVLLYKDLTPYVVAQQQLESGLFPIQ